jgi:hypothetical protein
MSGTMSGGRIEGHWEQTSFGGRRSDGPRGTFAMERLSVIESQHRQD